MAQLLDADYNSNTYFFLTNYSERMGAGRNSFIINPTQYVVPDQPIFVKAYDTKGNELPCGEIRPTNAKFAEETNTGKFYYVNVSEDTVNGIGKLQVRGIGVNLLEYTGSVAYYNGNGYKVSKDQRLPLISAPSSENLLQSVEVIWSRNFLIDTTRKTDSEVRFFTSPYIRARPEIYTAPQYPTGSYKLATGNFSTIALNPKNNADGDYDYQFDNIQYQLFWQSGTKFSASMENQTIRLKNPTVTNFKYSEYQNAYQGILNTDFIARIKRVVNDNTLLLDVPFTTVSGIINLTNEDSQYAKNNLTEIKGFNINDDPYNQNVFHKTNFYSLTLSDGQFEIFYDDIPIESTNSNITGSTYMMSVLNVEHNNIRVLCGALDSYKMYGRSLNSPESKVLLAQGKIEPDQTIKSNKFNNGLYNNPAHFYNQSYLSKHWFINGACTFYHSNNVLMNGAYIAHSGNESLSDYVIYKDNTNTASQSSTYYSYNIVPQSYWYANSPAIVNYAAYPTSSYLGLSNLSLLNQYTASQENLTNGIVYDSNSIKVRQNTLYKFSMRVKAAGENSNAAKLYTYYISGTDKKMIGYIDSSYNYGASEMYENTFFCEQEAYGTIILVPVRGSWNISDISIEPYQNIDYSIDSFGVKIPFPVKVPNELYEIEMELYDAQNRLAYGKDSYTFHYNKKFMPLKTRLFLDPSGAVANDVPITVVSGGGGGGGGTIIDIVLDGGDATST